MRTQRLVGLFALGFVLFQYPLLALSSREATVLGLPLLLVYLLGVWAVLIGAAAWLVHRPEETPEPPADGDRSG